DRSGVPRLRLGQGPRPGPDARPRRPPRVLHQLLPGDRHAGDRRRGRRPARPGRAAAGALAAAGLLLLLAGAVLAHLRHRDQPRLLAPALVAGLLVAASLITLIGGRP